MRIWCQYISLGTFLLGIYLLLCNLYQPRLWSVEVTGHMTWSRYELPNLAERLPDIIFSSSVLAIGILGIYIDLSVPVQRSRCRLLQSDDE